MNFKKISALACAMTIMGGMATSMPVLAATHAETTVTTPVTYDNRDTVDVDGNGKWGVVIPTAITFTDENKTGVNADVEITGINGYDLDRDFASLEVQGTISSQNTFKLAGEGDIADSTVAYQYELGSKTYDADAIDLNVDQMNLTTKKLTGRAKLTEDAAKKGKYADTITFAFNGESTLK